MTPVHHDLIIIGGGPAGLTAGLYAARARLNTVLVERFAPGGQVLNTDWVENYPGFPDGVSGFELIDKMKAQVDRFELPTLSAEVQEISPPPDDEGLFTIRLDKESLTAKAVVICTGAEPRRLGVEGEAGLTGRGVSYCGTCDGPFFRDQVIAAVGGGDTACQEALFLTRFAKEVILLHRRDELRAQKIIQERVMANEKIRLLWDTVAEKIEGEEKVEGIEVRNVKTGEKKRLDVDGIFIFVGIRPNTGFLAGLVEMDKTGFIITDTEMATSQPGLFAAGDCRAKALRQIANAVGDGATALFSAEGHIESMNHA